MPSYRVLESLVVAQDVAVRTRLLGLRNLRRIARSLGRRRSRSSRAGVRSPRARPSARSCRAGRRSSPLRDRRRRPRSCSAPPARREASSRARRGRTESWPGHPRACRRAVSRGCPGRECRGRALRQPTVRVEWSGRARRRQCRSPLLGAWRSRAGRWPDSWPPPPRRVPGSGTGARWSPWALRCPGGRPGRTGDRRPSRGRSIPGTAGCPRRR